MDTERLDLAWISISAALVFFMQVGFCCIESGMTRQKNSINVAIKNMTDVTLSSLLFGFVGFGLMFGDSLGGWIGISHFVFDMTSAHDYAFFAFQMVFCSTACTIVSGSIAERTSFLGYLLVCCIVSAFIYPMVGHWVWGGASGGKGVGILQELGFIDFAGSTIVHSVGGWVALAAAIVVGPRVGRFGPSGEVYKISGASMPLAIMGTLIMWFGWVGFNGGSALTFDDSVPLIIVNTLLGGAAGGLTTMMVGYWETRIFQVSHVINGVLAGLVAVTANCFAIVPLEACLIGGIGGIVMLLCSKMLMKLKIDDAVDAIGVHLASGAWGTLAVAIFCDLAVLDTGLSRLAQFNVQLVGIAAVGIWSFGISYAFMKITERFVTYRVPLAHEIKGLNVAEHDASTDVLELVQTIQHQTFTGDLSKRAKIAKHTEVGQISEAYNKLLDRVELLTQEVISKNKIIEKLNKAHLRQILRSINEVIVVVDEKLQVTDLYSESASRVFGNPSVDGRPVLDTLYPESRDDEGQARDSAKLELALNSAFLLLDTSHFDSCFEDVQKNVTVKLNDGEEFPMRLSFSPVIVDNKVARVVVVGVDARLLEKVRMQAHEAFAKIGKNMQHIQKLLSNKESFNAVKLFLKDGMPAVLSMKDKLEAKKLDNLEDMLRQLHGLRDSINALDFDFLDHFIAQSEELIIEIEQKSEPSADLLKSLLMNMEELTNGLNSLKFFWDRGLDQISGYQASSRSELITSGWKKLVNHLRSSTEKLALEKGKLVNFDIQSEVALSGEDFTIFSKSIMRLLKNAAEHGIEKPRARLANGKRERGEISVRVSLDNGRIVVYCTDDGSGVDLLKIRERAKRSDIAQKPNELLNQFILRVISNTGQKQGQTKAFVGRSIGMASVVHLAEKANGSLKLIKTDRNGTTFEIKWPSKSQLFILGTDEVKKRLAS